MLRSESTGHVHLGQGGPDHPSIEGGGEEEAGGDEDGGADEGGEEGAVDGLSPGTWLGEKRSMPRSVKKKSKNIFQNTISIYLFQNPPNSYNNFVINVGRRKWATTPLTSKPNHYVDQILW